MRGPGLRAGIPVICLGNPVVGGGGKTPAALAIGRLLRTAGGRPYFLTRGYGGRRQPAFLVDLDRHNAAETGDEPLLLARVAPTVVARDRPSGAAIARNKGATAIVMDDGFQNPSIRKDVSILVIDGRRGIGNARTLHAGPLRAPWPGQLEQADALIVVGEIVAAADLVAHAQVKGVPVFRARIEPLLDALGGPDQHLLAFAGIADPEKFFATLEAAGYRISVRRPFPDHYRYKPRDAVRLLNEADEKGLRLVTTEKDFVRLGNEEPLRTLTRRTSALPIKLVLDCEAEFLAWLVARMS
jgi:tetraacyldisaccharide 4'-kinase